MGAALALLPVLPLASDCLQLDDLFGLLTLV